MRPFTKPGEEITIGGQKLNLLKRLGDGSYGYVYLINTSVHGTDETEQRDRAIKIITNPRHAGIQSLREIDVMSRFSHINLTPAEGLLVGINSQVTVGLIMPLAQTDLHELLVGIRLGTIPPLSLSEKTKILHDIVSGLDFLHRHRAFHLDLKPQNVLLFPVPSVPAVPAVPAVPSIPAVPSVLSVPPVPPVANPVGNLTRIAKLTDFGLLLYGDGMVNYPSELVTITHRPPEILEEKHKINLKYSTATDIWSLGIIFIEVLSNARAMYKDYEPATIKHFYDTYLKPGVIDNTLNWYLNDLPSTIKISAIDIIKKMLNFDPTQRPSTQEILSSGLFVGLLPEVKSTGTIKYEKPQAPRECNIIYYYGFDYMIRLALLFPLKTETVFLAADIYQRVLAFAHKLTGNFVKDWPNVSLTATTSLFMAIKMVEYYDPDPKSFSKLATGIFKPEDILRTEAAISQLFNGILYSDNFFTVTNNHRLIEAFELLRNCHRYHKINLEEWRDTTKPKGTELFSLFIQRTNYYKLMGDKTQRYLQDLYLQDQ